MNKILGINANTFLTLVFIILLILVAVVIVIIVVLMSKKKVTGVHDINGIFHKYGEWYSQNIMDCQNHPNDVCYGYNDGFTLVLDRPATPVEGLFLTRDDGITVIKILGQYDVDTTKEKPVSIIRTDKYEIQKIWMPSDATTSRMRYMPLGSTPQ